MQRANQEEEGPIFPKLTYVQRKIKMTVATAAKAFFISVVSALLSIIIAPILFVANVVTSFIRPLPKNITSPTTVLLTGILSSYQCALLLLLCLFAAAFVAATFLNFSACPFTSSKLYIAHTLIKGLVVALGKPLQRSILNQVLI